MDPQRILTSYGLAVIPVSIIGLLHVSVEPLASMFAANNVIMYSAYGLSLVAGFLLLKKTRIKKDHEWQRSRAMVELDSHFKAEDKGVWEAPDAHVDTELSPSGINALGGKVESLNREGEEEELDQEEEVEVNFLMETSHVIKATRRVTGEENFDEEQVQSTLGARRKSSPMDRFFDFFSRLFNKGANPEDERHQKNVESLQVRAFEDPVEVSPPQVPQVETVVEGEEETPSAIPTVMPQTESLESMAMMGTVQSTVSGVVVQSGLACATCGHHNEPEEKYCSGCGMNL